MNTANTYINNSILPSDADIHGGIEKTSGILSAKNSPESMNHTAETVTPHLQTNYNRPISQFELINLIYKSKLFQRIDLKPTAKLVLYALVHHYNPANEDMFPSQRFIAHNLGISEKSVERAVKELAQSRLIMYVTKSVNRYKFTATFFDSVKMSEDNRQNVQNTLRQNVCLTNKHEQSNNNKVSLISNFKPQNSMLQTPIKPYVSKEKTQELLEKIENEKKSKTSPANFSRIDAENWLKKLPPELHGGSMAREIYQKHGFAMPEYVKEVLVARGRL